MDAAIAGRIAKKRHGIRYRVRTPPPRLAVTRHRLDFSSASETNTSRDVAKPGPISSFDVRGRVRKGGRRPKPNAMTRIRTKDVRSCILLSERANRRRDGGLSTVFFFFFSFFTRRAAAYARRYGTRTVTKRPNSGTRSRTERRFRSLRAQTTRRVRSCFVFVPRRSVSGFRGDDTRASSCKPADRP